VRADDERVSLPPALATCSVGDGRGSGASPPPSSSAGMSSANVLGVDSGLCSMFYQGRGKTEPVGFPAVLSPWRSRVEGEAIARA
jgi:hypothetical protein